MTRVNLVVPENLTDQHLIAERLELTWVVKSAVRSMNSKKGLSVHPTFTLGQGHVSFFHNKLRYIKNRFDDITQEMKIRGMNPQMEFPSLQGIPDDMMLDYKMTSDDYQIIKARIRQRLLLKPEWYRYFGKPIDLAWIDATYSE